MTSLATSDISILNIGLLVILLLVGAAIYHSRNVVRSAIYLGILSLLTAALFLNMQAPDVAITEAAIGSAISTLFLLIAAHKTGEAETENRQSILPALLVVVPLTATMFFVICDMPTYGASSAPATTGAAASHYIYNSYTETHIPNTVTSVLASYRGFDTLGETYVIFAALLSVLLILPAAKSEAKNA
jgi:multicomponent Na+:H+ antiporter subunit B